MYQSRRSAQFQDDLPALLKIETITLVEYFRKGYHIVSRVLAGNKKAGQQDLSALIWHF